jgi:hypothetical protein
VPVYAARSYALNQGDVFLDVPFQVLPGPNVPLGGCVVTHDCDLDKYDRAKPEEREVWTVTVAPVDPLDTLEGGRPKAVREGGMPRYFYLPNENERGELVVDLWLGQPVRVLALLDCERMESLSDDARAALSDHLIWLWAGPRGPGQGARNAS